MVRETEYKPDTVSPPGTTLLELLEDNSLTQSDFALRCGVTSKHVNEIVKGRAPISPAIAVAFEQVLGVPARFWITRESRYQEFLARKEWQKKSENYLTWAKSFPLSEMVKLGYLDNVKGDLEIIQELLRFFKIASPEHWHQKWDKLQPSFRIARKRDPDRHALSAWLCRGEQITKNINCRVFDRAGFAGIIPELRLLTTQEPEEFQPELERLCARFGVAVVFVPELKNTHVSGATRWIAGKAVIQLSLRYKTDDMLWFAFFHEACHVLRHPMRNTYIQDNSHPDNDYEVEADKWAADTLIPPSSYKAFARNHLSKREIREFANEIGISPGIVVGRLQHDKYLPVTHCNDLKQRYEWTILLER